MMYLPRETDFDDLIIRRDLAIAEQKRILKTIDEFHAYKDLFNLFPDRFEFIRYLRDYVKLLESDLEIDQTHVVMFSNTINAYENVCNFCAKGMYETMDAVRKLLEVSEPLAHYIYMFNIKVDITPLYKPN